jgi:hypothetical protein
MIGITFCQDRVKGISVFIGDFLNALACPIFTGVGKKQSKGMVIHPSLDVRFTGILMDQLEKMLKRPCVFNFFSIEIEKHDGEGRLRTIRSPFLDSQEIEKVISGEYIGPHIRVVLVQSSFKRQATAGSNFFQNST